MFLIFILWIFIVRVLKTLTRNMENLISYNLVYLEAIFTKQTHKASPLRNLINALRLIYEKFFRYMGQTQKKFQQLKEEEQFISSKKYRKKLCLKANSIQGETTMYR